MMGNKAGFIRCLEEKLGRPLQWVVCLLHCNKLPLTHVFLELHGTTKCPDSFSGPVGKKLNGKVSTWPVKNFEAIENANFPKLPDDIVDDLSSDQYTEYASQSCQDIYILICKSFRSALLFTQDGWLWPAAFFVFIHQQNSLQKVWCNWQIFVWKSTFPLGSISKKKIRLLMVQKIFSNSMKDCVSFQLIKGHFNESAIAKRIFCTFRKCNSCNVSWRWWEHSSKSSG